MRKVRLIVLALVAICLLAAPLALGQGGNPPASTKESGQTSAVATAASDSRVLMEEMTTTEVRDAVKAGKTTVLIFNGSTEASGPAVALGKHVYRARYLGERIARELATPW